MNIERMKELADHLRGLDSSSQPGFYMGDWYEENALDWRGNECKSVACIAGHAVYLFSGIGPHMASHVIRDRAQEYLELTHNQAYELFTAHGQNFKRSLSPEDAADALERMMKAEKPWL
ncbi:MAG: hypothetical protein L0Y60_04310 [Beijerinckiaceae bacterium]|nr:hypothetical protein [Beijerinckiaceae bacterium]